MRYGFTLVWVGWEFDVPRPADGDADPRAGRPRIAASRSPASFARDLDRRTRRERQFAVGDLAGYDAIDPGGGREHADGMRDDDVATLRADRARAVALNGHTVTLDGGFEPGTTYQVSYRAANPPIAGLGFAPSATRPRG